jgi:thioredoxin 1
MCSFPEVTMDTFQTQVQEAPLPVLVDFSAPWCAPCKRLEPLLEQLSQEWEKKMIFVKVNVDVSPDLSMKYQVMSVPTVILFRAGKETARLVGLQTREKLVEQFFPG